MKNILLFTLLLCCVTLRSQTYSIYPIPQKTTMNGNSIEMTREVNLIKEPGINEMISNRIQEVLTNAGINFTISDVFTDDKTNILIGINGSKGIETIIHPTIHSLKMFSPLHPINSTPICYR